MTIAVKSPKSTKKGSQLHDSKAAQGHFQNNQARCAVTSRGIILQFTMYYYYYCFFYTNQLDTTVSLKGDRGNTPGGSESG